FTLLAVQLLAVCSHPLAVVLIPVWGASALFWDRSWFARGCRLGLIVATGLVYLLAVRHRAYDPFSGNVLDRTFYLLSVTVFLESVIGPALVLKLHESGLEWLDVTLGAVLFIVPVLAAFVGRRRLGPAERRFLGLMLWLIATMMWVSAATRPLPRRPDL